MGIAALHSCNISKKLPPNQYLLIQNKVETEKPHKKEMLRELQGLYRQKPNSKLFFVFRTKPYFYLKGNQGKDNGYRRFLRDKLGEQAVLLDSGYAQQTTRRMVNYMKSKGYYYAEVTYAVETNKKKQATVTYFVKKHTQYKFGPYYLHIADKEIDQLVREKLNESFVVSGRGLDHDKLYKEQERIVNLLRNNGYYTMSKDFIDFDIDTAFPDNYVSVGLNIRNPDELHTHKKYFVNDVTLEIERSVTGKTIPASDSVKTKRFYYEPNGYRLNPDVLDRNIFFDKGDLFKQDNLNRSYGRLADLGIFRFINIQPKPFEQNDSGFVNYYARLIPSGKYDFTLEPQTLTSDQNNTVANQGRNYGIALLAQLMDRNVFRSAEVLQLSYRGSLEAQGQVKTAGFFNSTEQSLTASIIMPRTLFLPTFDRKIGFLSNKTSISLSGIYEINTEYRREVITLGYNYQFNRRLITYNVSPLEISFIKSDIVSDALEERKKDNLFLQTLFANNLIVSSRFGFVYTDKPIAKTDFSVIRWDVLELGGNTITFLKDIFGDNKDQSGRYRMFGINYFQYVKTAIDYRYNDIIDQNNTIVYRGFIGAAIPYGNSPDFVPFEKRFFAGGVNSLRGWRPRSVGPGSYRSDAQLDFSGELKLELNVDFRFNIYNKWLEGALFADAGNVWNVKPAAERPNAHFDPDRFFKEIAFNTGAGVRFNFEILVVRFDFALPMHDPRFAEGKRWIIKNINADWLLNNTNFNFGIGYPF